MAWAPPTRPTTRRGPPLPGAEEAAVAPGLAVAAGRVARAPASAAPDAVAESAGWGEAEVAEAEAGLGPAAADVTLREAPAAASLEKRWPPPPPLVFPPSGGHDLGRSLKGSGSMTQCNEPL